MRSSAISSATQINRSRATPPRKSFALTGPSRPLDPRTNAVRRDIADVRLADRVFAPHYAEAVARTVLIETALREDRDPSSDVIKTIRAGEQFELLDLTGGVAWGIVTARGLVGYVDASALDGAG